MNTPETQVVWVGPIATGTYKDLMMQHGNCDGGTLRWEGLLTNRLVCDACGKSIYIIDLSKLVSTARTGETSELDGGNVSVSPQRYEKMSPNRLEVALLRCELERTQAHIEQLKKSNTRFADQIEHLLETIDWAAGELEKTKGQFGSSTIAQIRRELQRTSKAYRKDC